ncbi:MULTISPECIES: ABC transporter ATP-binding protein [Burkholderia]|jgi:NitT/TauT family transport system ATP-binding protein|uniref:ABC transporter ATP-binding protein n=4 Tax=Burkholderia cenocepacia TaxID=95486 RepID=A0A1V2W018_9BURK|nr:MULTISPECIES: ABC transporter ATP-binding protein [Burkholderia]AIO49080.1 ABC transporter family protein [Burkholderia cepacia]ALV55846.1 sulfonate ABC transporter ATP-binding protein [Burkholderia cenocepacia]AMU06665.1 sulfonate ABC transporter ATP-binding protein [Burkholderia cenocepacia]AMU17702.1 sulfonate ABC transporter ATP-binding protein [Burkholderia cenocepacia]AQQ20714.1 sulfonate ABC transporter ATP-binding protein [Burkholderia cenocepacia]
MSTAEITAPAPGRVGVRALTIELGPPHARFAALDALDVDIAPGEFVCVLGPSGCGKSTLLGALAGHVAATHGEIVVDGEPVDRPHPDRGLVFQQHTLFPWKRVIDNVAFGLKMKGVPAHERRREAAELLELVGLGGFGAHYPSQLSGGMQQRVEIARVLINRPRVLLMDEPFGALDAQTRRMMQTLLLDIWSRIGTTVLFVTHDIEEALFLGDRILMLSPRPARIVADIRVPLARPRTDDSTTEPAFVEIKRRCLALLRDAA